MHDIDWLYQEILEGQHTRKRMPPLLPLGAAKVVHTKQLCMQQGAHVHAALGYRWTGDLTRPCLPKLPF
jgi:hypothetical protein